jgi:hypothetical protein
MNRLALNSERRGMAADGFRTTACHRPANPPHRQRSQQVGGAVLPGPEAEIEYGVGLTADDLDKHLRDLCRELGEREASRKLGISRTALRRAIRLGVEAVSRAMLGRLAEIAEIIR